MNLKLAKKCMHPSKAQNLTLTVLCMAMTVFIVVGAWRKPEALLFSLLFAPLFAFTSGIGVISVFLPNTWYRHREQVTKRYTKVA